MSVSGNQVANFLVSSGILLTLLLIAFGLGYCAKENDLPLPPFVKQYIPETSKAQKAPTVGYEQGGKQPIERGAAEGKYVLPVGVSIDEFTHCLESRARPLIDGTDFYIKELSSLIRVVIPRARDDEMSAGYEDCRSRLARR